MVRTLGSNYFKRYNLSRNCPGSIGNMHMEKQISKQEDNFQFDNMAVVSILNNKSSKNDRVMSLLRKLLIEH